MSGVRSRFPELGNTLLRVLALGKLDHGAHNLLLVGPATALFGVVAEHPYIGLALAFQQTQGTSLVSLRLHANLLCTRTDGCRRVYMVDSRCERDNSHEASDLLFFPANQSSDSLSRKRPQLP